MTYTCHDCGFLFQRIGIIKECPGCEKNNIRLATEEETSILLQRLTKDAQRP